MKSPLGLAVSAPSIFSHQARGCFSSCTVMSQYPLNCAFPPNATAHAQARNKGLSLIIQPRSSLHQRLAHRCCMMLPMNSHDSFSRRTFLAATSAMAVARGASSKDRLKAGLVGCGGPGTQAGLPLLTSTHHVDNVPLTQVLCHHVDRLFSPVATHAHSVPPHTRTTP